MSTTAPNPADLRTEVRDWLAQNWTALPPSDDPWVSSPEEIAWREKVLDAGYAVPTYPAEWFGRGYPSKLAAVIHQEFCAVKATGACQDKHNIPATAELPIQQDLAAACDAGRCQA